MENVDFRIQGQVSPRALERFEQPRNYGPLESFDGHARITGPCGDTMEFWLQVREGRIREASFTTDGCGPSRAAGSMATELVIGKSPAEAARIGKADVLAGLGGLPEESEHCALLAVNTLKAAIEDLASGKPGKSQDCAHCESATCPAKTRREDESDEQFRQRQALARRMCQIRCKLLVLSGKGGVGKSTVAANLAAALAQAGRRVGLLDIDVHGPSIPTLMGIEAGEVRGTGEALLPVRVSDNLAVMSVGFLLPDRRQAVIWRGPRKHGLIRQFLTDVAWGRLDYLVVDSPPGTGDEPMSIAQLVGPSAGAIIVTTPQEVAISDVRRCVTFCRELSLPVVGILENMSGLVCPKCGEQIDLFKRGGGMALAREMGVPFLGQIPIDPEVVTAGDAGAPLLRDGPQSPAAKAFADVVGVILAANLELVG
jgi:ATP-binding protein involved in chromosome partitioning